MLRNGWRRSNPIRLACEINTYEIGVSTALNERFLYIWSAFCFRCRCVRAATDRSSGLLPLVKVAFWPLLRNSWHGSNPIRLACEISTYEIGGLYGAEWPIFVRSRYKTLANPFCFTVQVCLGCYGPIKGRIQCALCGWLMCGDRDCPRAGHAAECELIRRHRPDGIVLEEFRQRDGVNVDYMQVHARLSPCPHVPRLPGASLYRSICINVLCPNSTPSSSEAPSLTSATANRFNRLLSLRWLQNPGWDRWSWPHMVTDIVL